MFLYIPHPPHTSLYIHTDASYFPVSNISFHLRASVNVATCCASSNFMLGLTNMLGADARVSWGVCVGVMWWRCECGCGECVVCMWYVCSVYVVCVHNTLPHHTTPSHIVQQPPRSHNPPFPPTIIHNPPHIPCHHHVLPPSCPSP